MMVQKVLQKGSKYATLDTDEDGTVSDNEFEKAQRIIDLENKDAKEDQLRRMAWIAMGSMVLFTGFLFLPILPIERLNALSSLLQMFYIAQAGVVATFFGASAYVSK